MSAATLISTLQQPRGPRGHCSTTLGCSLATLPASRMTVTAFLSFSTSVTDSFEQKFNSSVLLNPKEAASKWQQLPGVNVNVPLAIQELGADLWMVRQKSFISNDHANSRTMGQRHITTGLSGAHREMGATSGMDVKGQYHEKGRWQGPQMQPWAGFGASGRSCFTLRLP